MQKPISWDSPIICQHWQLEVEDKLFFIAFSITSLLYREKENKKRVTVWKKTEQLPGKLWKYVTINWFQLSVERLK